MPGFGQHQFNDGQSGFVHSSNGEFASFGIKGYTAVFGGPCPVGLVFIPEPVFFDIEFLTTYIFPGILVYFADSRLDVQVLLFPGQNVFFRTIKVMRETIYISTKI